MGLTIYLLSLVFVAVLLAWKDSQTVSEFIVKFFFGYLLMGFVFWHVIETFNK